MKKNTLSRIWILMAVLISGVNAQAQLLDALALDSVRTYRKLDRALAEPEKVYRLDLSGQKLKEIPPEVFQFTNLNALDLSGNKIKDVPEELKNLKYMQELRLSRNKLTEVPKSLCHLVHLKRLDMSRNALEALPTCIGALTELISLDLWDNDLAEFPEELAELDALRYMDLRAIQFEVPEMEHIQELVPKAKVYFSQPCNCGM